MFKIKFRQYRHWDKPREALEDFRYTRLTVLTVPDLEKLSDQEFFVPFKIAPKKGKDND